MAVLTPEFWDEAWQEFLKKNRPEEGKAGYEQAERWNKRAERFSRRVGGEQGRNRVEQVFEFLNFNGVLNDTLKILDIGSGPGIFALPFAEAGHGVVALDPADKMLEILKQKLAPDLSQRVTTVQGLWEELDVKTMGWERQFDLVFASMTPGVRDMATLQKMIACSRKWCYLSTFSGPRRYLLLEEIWPELCSKQFINHVNDVIFPFNILYALAYKPFLSITDISHSREDGADELIQDILEHVAAWGEIKLTPDIENKVKSIVAERASGGRVAHEIKSRVGMILWAVD